MNSAETLLVAGFNLLHFLGSGFGLEGREVILCLVDWPNLFTASFAWPPNFSQFLVQGIDLRALRNSLMTVCLPCSFALFCA